MANTYYSSLYEAAPNRGGSVSLPRSPSVTTRGVPVTEIFSFAMPAVTLGIGDVIKLMPAIPAGARVTRLVFTAPTGLDGGAALVANLGFASQASGAGLLTGSTAFRGAATTSLTDAQVTAGSAAGGTVTATTNLQAAGSWDELQITVTTGAASSPAASTNTILVEYIAP